MEKVKVPDMPIKEEKHTKTFNIVAVTEVLADLAEYIFEALLQ
jgi:hypothetical protein